MIIKTKNDISMFDQLWWTFSFTIKNANIEQYNLHKDQ